MAGWTLRGVLALTAAAALALAVSCATTGAHHGPPSDHFDGTRFHNPEPVAKTLADLVRWRLSRRRGHWEWRDLPQGQTVPANSVPASKLGVTLVNHATLLLQTAQLNVLTDPIWSERASPFESMGPSRHRPPGVAFDALPPIHAVLISHNHFDHMDLPTLRRLAAVHHPLFIVPLGNRRYLEQAGIETIAELDWWDTLELGHQVSVSAVPARHWSQRELFDRNRALWAGYVLAAPWGRVYFAGDTGMGEHFNAIRQRLGPVDLALLPIGSYQPRWFMREQHINPAEAVQAHGLLGAGQSIAMHFGTFELADDGQDQPVHDLRKALQEAALPIDFRIARNGQAFTLEYPPLRGDNYALLGGARP